MAFESILSITELNLYVKKLVGSHAPLQDLWVRGEVSNSVQHRSGHVYFTLKDESSQIVCTMFKSQSSLLKFKFEDGLRIIVRGNVDLYLARGQYQLNIVYAMPDGIGALHLAFEQLKKKLEAEGLFSIARKRPIPRYPQKIGIATSVDGEALRDILAVIRRRNPDVEVYLASTLVQGDGSSESIVRSIELLNKIADLDVIIVGRGGGSIEDLWAFNEEAVARAICSSRVPVVSAVGHEGDFTIADFVADMRTPTPSAAAEIVVQDRKTLEREITVLEQRLYNAIRSALYNCKRSLREIINQLNPEDLLLNQHYQRVDELGLRLQFLIEHKIEVQKQVLRGFDTNLKALSPLEILERGYCLAMKKGRVVRSAGDVECGEKLKILTGDGKIVCRVESKEEGKIWKNAS